jgi:tyrosine-protein phosphatase YwqE
MAREASAHLGHMRKLIETMRERQSDIEAKMIAITQERARLAQAAMQHADKMQVARGSQMATTDELLQNLADKYQVPISEVQSLLTARSIDAGPGS